MLVHIASDQPSRQLMFLSPFLLFDYFIIGTDRPREEMLLEVLFEIDYLPTSHFGFCCPNLHHVIIRLSHKLLGNFSAIFEIFGNFLEFWQLLEFSATLGFLRFFEATFFTF